MNCPVDGSVLQMTERSGIEIDYCPTCRGVWLDRGELDKIIERGAELMPPAASAAGRDPRFAETYRDTRREPPRPDERAREQPYRDDRYRDDRYRDDRDRDDRDRDRDDRYREHGYGKPYKKKKKGGFLGEIFDFD